MVKKTNKKTTYLFTEAPPVWTVALSAAGHVGCCLSPPADVGGAGPFS